MADLKISALIGATTPLAGTEVLPIVQSSATVKVSVANLTAGRALSVFGLTVSGLTVSTALALNASKELISVTNTGTGNNVLATTPTLVGDVTLSTGNLVVSNGKGIDFSATPGTGTSELFSDYEEGTWTPTVTPATGSFTTVTAGTCTYTKIGRIVMVNARFTLTNSGTGAGAMTINGLPFTIANAYDQNTFSGRMVNSGTPIFGQLIATTTSVSSFQTISGTTAIVNGYIYTFSATYTA